MPKYIVEQYKLYSAKYEVDAKSKAEAIAKVQRGGCEMLDDIQLYIGVADLYGKHMEDLEDECEVSVGSLREHANIEDDHVIGIRSVEESEEE